MRKIIQIAISESSEGHEQWALCDDGSVWSYVWPKTIFEEVPATPERNYTSRKQVGISPATWLRMASIPQDNEDKS